MNTSVTHQITKVMSSSNAQNSKLLTDVFYLVAPTRICCDVCNQDPISQMGTPFPVLLQESTPASPLFTPSKSVNVNRKQVLITAADGSTSSKQPHTWKTGALLEQVQASLIICRFHMKHSCYNPSSVTVGSLLLDSLIKSISSARHITTIEELQEHTGWPYTEQHRPELLFLLKKIDKADMAQKQAAKAAMLAAHLAAVALKAEEKRERKRWIKQRRGLGFNPRKMRSNERRLRKNQRRLK